MLTAARTALQLGKPVCAPVSGFHHAGFDFGGGFCTFNGLAVAAFSALQDKLCDEVWILDFDHHWGNGTHDCLGHSPHGCADIRHYTVGRMGYGPKDGAAALAYVKRAAQDLTNSALGRAWCCTRPAQICTSTTRSAAASQPSSCWSATTSCSVPAKRLACHCLEPGRGLPSRARWLHPGRPGDPPQHRKGKPRMKHHVVSQVGSRWVVSAVEAVPMVGVSTTTLSTHATQTQALVAAAKLDGRRPPGWCQATTSGGRHTRLQQHTARRRRRAQSSRPRPGMAARRRRVRREHRIDLGLPAQAWAALTLALVNHAGILLPNARLAPCDLEPTKALASHRPSRGLGANRRSKALWAFPFPAPKEKSHGSPTGSSLFSFFGTLGFPELTGYPREG